nr:hypothetical protein [Desulfobulbaceae bacterium]
MWNNGFCDFGPMFGSGHWFGGWLFPILFWGIILWVIVTLFQKIFTANKDTSNETELDLM